MNEIPAIKPEILKFYLLAFFKSLNNYTDRYLGLFFIDPTHSPAHFAYLCPLCLKNDIIVEQSIGCGTHAEFSLDHFPPESIGGFQTLLVCKKCNSEAGTLYDFSLKQKIQNLAFNNKVPLANINSKSEITNVTGRYPSKLIIGEDGQIEITLKPNTKIHAPFLDKFIEYSKTKSDYTIQLSYNTADETKVSKALVKTAYLFCFDSWGYEFAFSNTGEMIRKFLNDECEYPTKTPSFWLGSLIRTQNIEHMPLGLCYLKEPVEWRSFVVNILMTDKETGFDEIASVLIPGPSKENWEDLKRVQQLLNGMPEMRISMAHVTENNLSNNILDGYARSWEFLHSNQK